MKQTAVEWLFTELCSENLSWNKDSNGKLFIDFKTWNLLNKAKEMEKNEIKDAFNQGYREAEFNSNAIVNKGDIAEFSDANKYYRETFKQQ